MSNQSESAAAPSRRKFVKNVALAAASTAILGQAALSNVGAAAAADDKYDFGQTSGAGSIGKGINVLLVHGVFVDASSWSGVIPLLQKLGYNVLAVQNPNTSLEDDITTTSQALASLTGPTIMVGHSYGGFVISNITAPNVVGLVYSSAYGPEAGETVMSINNQFPATPVGPEITASYRTGFIWIKPVSFPQVFVQDIDASRARAIAATEKPLSPVCFGTPSGNPTWKTVPSWFLVSKNDRVISPDAERFMAKRMKAHTIEISSSHASPVAHPEAVTGLVVAASIGVKR